ncbi:uncharacterized protein LOC144872242 [Branchiostoma floridae x Branchiostoma japonicum]
MSGYIPVVDFSAYSLDNKTVDDSDLAELTDELMQAFTTVGFVYLKNTGIPTSEVYNVFDVFDEFCFLPESVKEKYSRPLDNTAERHGWMALERETLLPKEDKDNPPPGDLKECFNIHPPLTEGQTFPEEVPEFQPVMTDFYNKCHVISTRLLQLIDRGLGTMMSTVSWTSSSTSEKVVTAPTCEPSATLPSRRRSRRTKSGAGNTRTSAVSLWCSKTTLASR